MFQQTFAERVGHAVGQAFACPVAIIFIDISSNRKVVPSCHTPARISSSMTTLFARGVQTRVAGLGLE
jgi:hypothetical protein